MTDKSNEKHPYNLEIDDYKIWVCSCCQIMMHTIVIPDDGVCVDCLRDEVITYTKLVKNELTLSSKIAEVKCDKRADTPRIPSMWGAGYKDVPPYKRGKKIKRGPDQRHALPGEHIVGQRNTVRIINYRLSTGEQSGIEVFNPETDKWQINQRVMGGTVVGGRRAEGERRKR